ncbi:MAG TPA: hypothetical protein VK599_00460 [Streptosporangiaceae bacterium]|jgi:hypothetical protein|nr:hypothetical protein [Streptosporangiaceae bacterium]
MSRIQLAAGVPVALALSRWRFSKLHRVDPHPFGLAVIPPLMPMMLYSEGWGAGLTDMSLSYGRPLVVSGQLIEVWTCFSEADCALSSVPEVIARAQQRDSAWAREDWENAPEMSGPEPFEISVPAAGFHRQERPVIIAGQQQVVTVVSRVGYEGLRFRHGSMVVTAVARLGFEGVSFEVVDDLEPYLAGYTRFVLGWLRFWAA